MKTFRRLIFTHLLLHLVGIGLGTSIDLDPNRRPFYEEDWNRISDAIFAEVISSDYEIRKSDTLLTKEAAHKEISELAKAEEYRYIDENYTFLLRYELKIIEDFKKKNEPKTTYTLEYPADFLLWYHFIRKRPSDGEKKVFINLTRNRLFADPNNKPGWRFFDEDMADGINEFLKE